MIFQPNVTSGFDLDKMFFQKASMGAHSKGMKKIDIMGSVNKYVTTNYYCILF